MWGDPNKSGKELEKDGMKSKETVLGQNKVSYVTEISRKSETQKCSLHLQKEG